MNNSTRARGDAELTIKMESRAREEEAVRRVTDLLVRAGYQNDGTVRSQLLSVFTLRSQLSERPGRWRMVRGDVRVTVGPRSIFFYSVVAGRVRALSHHATRDTRGIAREAARLAELSELAARAMHG